MRQERTRAQEGSRCRSLLDDNRLVSLAFEECGRNLEAGVLPGCFQNGFEKARKGLFDGLSAERQNAVTAVSGGRDETGFAQPVEVVGETGLRAQGIKGAAAKILLRKLKQDLAPCGVGERFKNLGEVQGRLRLRLAADGHLTRILRFKEC